MAKGSSRAVAETCAWGRGTSGGGCFTKSALPAVTSLTGKGVLGETTMDGGLGIGLSRGGGERSRGNGLGVDARHRLGVGIFFVPFCGTGIWLSMKEASREVESESKKLEKDSLESAVREAISVLGFSNGSKRSSWAVSTSRARMGAFSCRTGAGDCVLGGSSGRRGVEELSLGRPDQVKQVHTRH